MKTISILRTIAALFALVPLAACGSGAPERAEQGDDHAGESLRKYVKYIIAGKYPRMSGPARLLKQAGPLLLGPRRETARQVAA